MKALHTSLLAALALAVLDSLAFADPTAASAPGTTSTGNGALAATPSSGAGGARGPVAPNSPSVPTVFAPANSVANGNAATTSSGNAAIANTPTSGQVSVQATAPNGALPTPSATPGNSALNSTPSSAASGQQSSGTNTLANPGQTGSPAVVAPPAPVQGQY